MGENSVTIMDEGYKIVKIKGTQTLETFSETLKKAREANAELSSRFGTINNLWDLSEMANFPEELVHGSKIFAFTSSVDKTAFYGVPEQFLPVITMITKEIKDQNTVRYFTDKEEAVKWLLANI